MEHNKIHLGDAYKLIKELDDNSIDCVVTDPPYGLEFMAKDWDLAVPKKDMWVD